MFKISLIFMRMYFYTVLFLFITNIAYSADINNCIRNAIKSGVELNKILTLCKENIKNIEVYSNTYNKNNKPIDSSEYISTSKTDKIIHEMIKDGKLSKAGRLAERQEEEKTKRIKARAEAEALRSPQIIATTTRNTDSSAITNVRSVISLGSNPIKTISSGSKILEITTPGAHGAIAGQYVSINDVNSSIDGIAASEINKRHVISSVPTISTFRISVLSSANTGSVSGGGSSIIATFEN